MAISEERKIKLLMPARNAMKRQSLVVKFVEVAIFLLRKKEALR